MIRMREILAALGVAATAAAAAAPALAACDGPDFLTGITRADPGIAQRLDAETAATPFAKGRFWRIEKDGRVSHAFGTFHSPAPAIARIPVEIEAALDGARVLLVEVLPEEQERMQALMAQDPGLVMNLTGRPLTAFLGPEEMRGLDALLRPYGMNAQAATAMQPWFVNLLLSTPPCVLEEMTAGEEVLDARLIAEARARRIPVEGLERIEDALEIFRSIPEAEQISLLRMNIAVGDISEPMMVSSERLYLQGEIWRIWAMNGVMAEAVGLGPELSPMLELFYDRALVERNRNWMPEILAELARGDALIAVGALHLAGPDSLQAMLEAEGYSVTRLDLPGEAATAPDAPEASEKKQK